MVIYNALNLIGQNISTFTIFNSIPNVFVS